MIRCGNISSMTTRGLIQKAKSAVKINKESADATAGEVGSAIVSANGNVHVGTSIDTACGIGYCMETMI